MNKSILIALFSLVVISEYSIAKDEKISAENIAGEISQGSEECANNKPDCRPRIKYISSSINEHKYAEYMKAWRVKVEKIGGMNYPSEAIKMKLYGALILDVGINPDGTLNSVTVKRSSGLEVLDDAAKRIVRLASPFSPFPESIRSEVDILHITEEWIFQESPRINESDFLGAQ